MNTSATARSSGAWIWLLALATLAAQQPRDGRPPPSPATASVAGSVVTRDGLPIDRAVVTVRSDLLPIGRSAITDDRGAFTIDGLPPGRMTIGTTKPGYLPGSYGATQPGGPGTPLVLSAGQSRSLAIAMTRGGVITGTIRDERGQPLPDLSVTAVLTPQAAGPSAVPNASPASARTDDRGVYRLFDLYPGDYLVIALPQVPRTSSGDIQRRRTAEIDAILARLQQGTGAAPAVTEAPAGQPPERGEPTTLAPTFHPGTPLVREASSVRLRGGDERAGIDFVVRPVPMASASGVITVPSGGPTSFELGITPWNWVPLGGLSSVQLLLLPLSDDRFTYVNMTPGRYTITARTRIILPKGSGPPPPGWPFHDPAALLYAVAEIDIAGADVTGIELRLRPGARVAGRVVTSSAGGSPPREQLHLALLPENNQSILLGAATLIGGFRQVRRVVPDSASGQFEIPALAPGRYRVDCTCGGWRMQSAIANGRDLLDTGLDATLGADIRDVVVTVTNRPTEIAGTLQTSEGLPAPDYFVIVFPADEALRVPNSRRIRTTRPATDGLFAFPDLPPGDYLLAALTDVDPGEWQKPEFLSALVPSSVKIALGEGEKKRQDLRIQK